MQLVISKPAGYVLVGQDHDRKEHHCVLAFFSESPGSPADRNLLLEYGITETGTGTLHSVTALVLVEGAVVAHDRTRVRSGVTIPD